MQHHRFVGAVPRSVGQFGRDDDGVEWTEQVVPILNRYDERTFQNGGGLSDRVLVPRNLGL